MQHLIFGHLEGDVEDEISTEDLLHRRTEVIDMGSMAEGRVSGEDLTTL